jgi:hypothetical protein
LLLLPRRKINARRERKARGEAREGVPGRRRALGLASFFQASWKDWRKESSKEETGRVLKGEEERKKRKSSKKFKKNSRSIAIGS